MTKLKLSAIPDDKPVKLAVELPALVSGTRKLMRPFSPKLPARRRRLTRLSLSHLCFSGYGDRQGI
ncbi:hypothetical protein D3C80_162880 [compost metagenome]